MRAKADALHALSLTAAGRALQRFFFWEGCDIDATASTLHPVRRRDNRDNRAGIANGAGTRSGPVVAALRFVLAMPCAERRLPALASILGGWVVKPLPRHELSREAADFGRNRGRA